MESECIASFFALEISTMFVRGIEAIDIINTKQIVAAEQNGMLLKGNIPVYFTIMESNYPVNKIRYISFLLNVRIILLCRI